MLDQSKFIQWLSGYLDACQSFGVDPKIEDIRMRIPQDITQTLNDALKRPLEPACSPRAPIYAGSPISGGIALVNS